MKSASICILQTTILKGFHNDEISIKLSKFLYSLGISTQKIVTIADNKSDIKNELQSMTKSSDIVLLSCNHSQEVFDAVAEAFNVNVVSSIGSHPSDDCRTNFKLPELSENFSTSIPIIKFLNIYILPNAISLLQLRSLQGHFLMLNNNSVFFNRFVHVRSNLATVAPLLSIFQDSCDLVTNYHHGDELTTKVILESKDLGVLIDCERKLKLMLEQHGIPTGIICSAQSVYELMARNRNVAEAFDVLEKCFSQYQQDEVFISFNGGKDCTVLLYITIAVLKKLYPHVPAPQIQCLYIQSSDPFDELNNFVTDTVQEYNLQLTTIKGSIRTALDTVLKTEPKYKATLMGTRKTDPFADTLEHFKMTDPGWPQVMRVNPILNWSYHEVWEFLRDLEIPYCCLYDMGYTSIGNTKNTVPNPALKRESGYLPAYLLTNGDLERDGRGNNI